MDKDLIKALIILFGSLILAAILIGIPVLTACSFFFNWHQMFKVLLSLSSVGEFLYFFYIISETF